MQLTIYLITCSRIPSGLTGLLARIATFRRMVDDHVPPIELALGSIAIHFFRLINVEYGPFLSKCRNPKNIMQLLRVRCSITII